MHKKWGGILLVAGTCIGSGMVALPLVLAKLGLIPSIFLMLLIWSVMYYTALINVELNLQAGEGLPLGRLGRLFSGKGAEWVGILSLKILSYSLLAVYIYGSASIIQEMLASRMALSYSFGGIATGFTLIVTILLLFPVKWIDYVNRFLFVGLLGTIMLLSIALVASVEWKDLPLFSAKYTDLTAWFAVIPVVFTAFGFQVIFHTLTNYYQKNSKLLRQVFFWGSLIPALIYIIWTSSILGVVHHEYPQFYTKMVEDKAEVGELIQTLSTIARSASIQLLVWWISLLAIATSVLGIGIGLRDSLREMLAKRVGRLSSTNRNILAALMTIVPAFLMVIFIPNAFIAVLGFAGMILAIIAIILPVYLFTRIRSGHLHFSELNKRWLIRLSFIVAIVVIMCELYNILYRT